MQVATQRNATQRMVRWVNCGWRGGESGNLRGCREDFLLLLLPQWRQHSPGKKAAVPYSLAFTGLACLSDPRPIEAARLFPLPAAAAVCRARALVHATPSPEPRTGRTAPPYADADAEPVHTSSSRRLCHAAAIWFGSLAHATPTSPCPASVPRSSCRLLALPWCMDLTP